MFSYGKFYCIYQHGLLSGTDLVFSSVEFMFTLLVRGRRTIAMVTIYT